MTWCIVRALCSLSYMRSECYVWISLLTEGFGWAKEIFHALQIGLSKEKQVLKQCLETETFKYFGNDGVIR